MPTRRRTSAAALLAAVLAVAGCAFGPPDETEVGGPPNLPPPTSSTSADDGPPSVVATVITQGLDVPWAIAFLPDGSALVTERDTARIVRVSPDGATVTPVQTIDEAQPEGEGGLLGIAVSPDYATDNLVFIYYTAANDNRIARLTLGGAPEPIVTGIPMGRTHNGGRLGFGPDGYLYASTGDAGTPTRAQDLGTPAGKILRMTKDGGPAPGNPYPDSLVWSFGHRNVQGLAWDSQGRMFATEFGQDTWDEINRIEAGNNYGWPEVEGIGDDSSFVDPLQVWPTSESSCSGAAITGDVLVAACLRGNRVWLMRLADGALAGPPVAALVGEYGRLRAATTAPDGSIWISTSNLDRPNQPQDSDDDRILRLVVAGGGGGLVLA